MSMMMCDGGVFHLVRVWWRLMVVVWLIQTISPGVLVEAVQRHDESPTLRRQATAAVNADASDSEEDDVIGGEFCLSETFNASCRRSSSSSSSPGQLIVMTSAEYGRMRSGRCVEMKYGQPCSEDVLRHLDAHCSGRPACSFPVTSLLQADVRPCDDELKSYLYAAYRCVTVTRESCAPNERRRNLTAQSGYIVPPGPSTLAAGSARCPWVIKVDSRQTIRVLLYTFSAGDGERQAECPVSVTFDGRVVKTLCRQRSSHAVRQRLLHSTDTNQLTISFKTTTHSAAPSPHAHSYLLQYEAVGCPTLRLPDSVSGGSAWIHQDSDTATVRCNQTDETWFLRCDGRTWKGSIGNCSLSSRLSVPNDAEPRTFKSGSLSFGLIVAVIIGVLLGVVIGAVPLGLAYVCLKRKWRHQRPDGYVPGDDVYDASGGLGKVVDVDASGRQQLYPALIPARHGGIGRSPSQHTAGPGYYAGPGCPHGPACPVHHQITDPGVVWDDCCARRLEHVYEIAAAGGFTTRCRAGANVIGVDDSSSAYLPPGQTDMTAADQLFDAGRV